MYATNILSRFHGSAHQIERGGLGYSRPLSDDEIARMAPAIFAGQAHESRSARYAFIPTRDLLAGMRAEGFMPVRVSQARARDESHRGHTKHLIRFRREDQMQSPEAREVVMINSHNGASGFQLMAGVFRLICANGLVVGHSDNEIRVRHSGDALHQVIEGAYRIVDDFDRIGESIEGMRAVALRPEHQQAFARAAMALRFEQPDQAGIEAGQLLRPRRIEDRAPDLWTTMNVVQENVIRGGLRGWKRDEHGRIKRASTREVGGIDQSTQLNKALWILAEEMRKLAA